MSPHTTYHTPHGDTKSYDLCYDEKMSVITNQTIQKERRTVHSKYVIKNIIIHPFWLKFVKTHLPILTITMHHHDATVSEPSSYTRNRFRTNSFNLKN